MKKTLSIITCCILALTLVACGSTNDDDNVTDTLSGPTADILVSVIDGAEGDAYMTFDEEVSATTASGIGLSESDITNYVSEGMINTAAISTFAHEIVLIKCNDAEAAKSVKSTMAANYNTGKWICVLPDSAYVVDSGSYVMLVASNADYAEAIFASFSALAGETLGERVNILVG